MRILQLRFHLKQASGCRSAGVADGYRPAPQLLAIADHADAALAHGDLSVMVGTIGIDDIIVPSEAAAKVPAGDPHDAAATASDDQVEDSEIKADPETGEANEVTEAAAVPQANAAQSRDGEQDG